MGPRTLFGDHGEEIQRRGSSNSSVGCVRPRLSEYSIAGNTADWKRRHQTLPLLVPPEYRHAVALKAGYGLETGDVMPGYPFILPRRRSGCPLPRSRSTARPPTEISSHARGASLNGGPTSPDRTVGSAAPRLSSAFAASRRRSRRRSRPRPHDLPSSQSCGSRGGSPGRILHSFTD